MKPESLCLILENSKRAQNSYDSFWMNEKYQDGCDSFWTQDGCDTV